MRPHHYAPRPAHFKWLLDSDPAIRWQVMKDLTGEATRRDCGRGDLALQPKAGEPNFSRASLLPATGATGHAGGETICRSMTGTC